MLHYLVIPDTLRHQWHITLKFSHNDDNPQMLKLANWVPGSYMIRDFSRHIITLSATCNGVSIELQQNSKNCWYIPAQSGEYQIKYSVYANDLSVRASLLDTQRGFIDGACLFLYLPKHNNEPHTLQFQGIPSDWNIYTTLPKTSNHTFQAQNYAELIDHPIELGNNIDLLEFTASGIPHRIAISGYHLPYDKQRLINDARRICETTLNLFPQPAPFHEYLFLLHVGDCIYGGLEHRNSTALHADRNTLPPIGMQTANNAYTQLLGLISHEYFHAWNVKSIKPQAFIPYNLDHETYTPQLWIFEGITSYYDDLILARSGVISPEHYLTLLAQTLTRVWRTPGRKQQTLAQSSFAAWHKYYKQDENSPNAITSYYQQGAMAALCLDLYIRAHTPYSLDTVMQYLYTQYIESGNGLTDGEFEQIIQNITGLDLNKFFLQAIYSNEDLPIQECLKNFGIGLRWFSRPQDDNGGLVQMFPESTGSAPDIGCHYHQNNHDATISHVLNGGAAELAGLKTNDKIIAINGFTCTDFTKQTCTTSGDRHILHFFRNGMLHQTELTVQTAAAQTALLKIEDHNALQQWLGCSVD